MRIIITTYFFLFVILLYGQTDSTRTIKGFVFISHEKGGLPGCSVIINNTLHGTMTDIAGKFELAIPNDKNVILVISCICEPVYIKTKKNKDFYKIKLDKQKPLHQIRGSAGILQNSINSLWGIHFDFGYGFSFGPGYRIKYLTGLDIHNYSFPNSNTNVYGLEIPLRIKTFINYRFYLQGSCIIGYPIFMKIDDFEVSKKLYINPEFSFGYQTNFRWGFELGFNYGLTDIGIKDNKISSLTMTVIYRIK
jgi:hypothetical protein